MKSSASLDSDARPPSTLSDRRIQLALDAGAIAGTWFWDVGADRLTADHRFARCFALDAVRLRAGVPLAEAMQSIHPDDVPRVRASIDQALALGGPYRAEYRVVQTDGGYRWLEANGHVALDDQGRARTFPGVLVDIDKRKQAEIRQAALLRLGDELRALETAEAIAGVAARLCGETLGASRAGYGIVDDVAERVDIDLDWCHGEHTASVAGLHRFRDFGSFIEDLQHGEVVAIADVAADTRTAAFHEALWALDIRALLNVPLMRDGRFRGVFLVHGDAPRAWTPEEVAFVRGVADRTWAAMATAEALAELRAVNGTLEREVEQRTRDRNRLWRLSRDIMMIARLEGDIVTINPGWEHALGWTEAELVGRHYIDLVHPDDQADSRARAVALAAGQSFSSFDNRLQHKSGDWRWISWSATPGDGLIMAAGRDVTDAKAQAASLQLAEERLRQSQKMEVVGQLTGGVAHDFNNLLTVISTSVALLRRPATSPEQRTRSIDAIAKTVTRAARLTGQLLAFARRQALTPSVFDAAQNVLAVTDMMAALVGARIEVATTMEDGCFIDADSSQFDTAIVNLVVNARDAMGGAGRLAVDVRAARVLPALRGHAPVAGDFVAVAISDTGTGIQADNLERIFEPFYTTKAPGEGTGLGLSQVFGFAKQSGGEVQVHSVVGQGTTFTLYFPRVLAAALQAAGLAAAPEADTAGGATLLVVEDNPEVAAAVEATLGALGYAIVPARGGAQALAEIERDAGRFAAVFSDVVMAGMDGITLAREIRRRVPGLPIILSSGYSHVLATETDHGFELLAKPYDLEQLARTMRRAISGAPPPAAAGLGRRALRTLLGEAENETLRQGELDSMRVLDTAPEDGFDDLVRMAAQILDVPIALVSLVDRDRQWFKARLGLAASQTPREHAFCAHAIADPAQVMVVRDARLDERFAANPLVTGAPGIRFYAGAPLVTSGGHALGTLCVISPEARDIEPRQKEFLQLLAEQVVKRLEQRRESLEAGAAAD